MLDKLKELGGLGNLAGLMTRAREMQEKMKVLQDELAKKHFAADVADGRVAAVVNGRMELVKVNIDKARIDVSQIELLEDLITAAVCAAQRKAAFAVQEDMSKMAADMGLPPGALPGT